MFGTPGTGDYRDLPPTQAGAKAAEARAVASAISGATSAAARAAKEAASKTISQHAETFVSTYKPGSKPAEKYEKQRVLDTHLLPVFGGKTIAQLRQVDLDEYAASELERGMAIKTVNNQLAVLSTLIKYVTGVRSPLRFKLDGMAAELRAVPGEHVELLLAVAVDPRWRAVLLLAVECGLRAAEIRGLQWTDVADGMLTVRRSIDKRTNAVIAPKHNKARTVPVPPRVTEALDRVPRSGIWVIAAAGELVPYDELADEVGAIYDRAEVPRPAKPLHALRHTYGTVMAARVPLPVLQALLGHADVKTTLRYVDVTEAAKRAAVEAVFGSAPPAPKALPPGSEEVET